MNKRYPAVLMTSEDFGELEGAQIVIGCYGDRFSIGTMHESNKCDLRVFAKDSTIEEFFDALKAMMGD